MTPAQVRFQRAGPHLRHTLRVLGLACLAVSTFAACTANKTCYATPAVAFPQPVLVYPAPNASAVPDGTAALVVAGSLPPSAPNPAFLLRRSVSQTTTPLGALTAPPSPLPSPLASYPPGLALGGVALPALAPATAYTVLLAETQTFGGCAPLPAPTVVVVSLGSFTTK